MAQELTIAIDAMGGDAAPDMVVEGVDIALVRHPGVRFLLFGDENRLKPLFDAHPRVAASAEIRHAEMAVPMDAKPSQALRTGRKVSSMWRAIDAVRQGEAQVAVSAGNTGALMAMAKVQLKTQAGIDRPAIAATWPTIRGESVVLDVGATVGTSARQLVEFAIMGEAFARVIFGIDRPTVGLLNIGVEEVKGNEAVKAAARILSEDAVPVAFHGFVEGDDIGLGTTDVVVTDGFTGNVALKTAEGTAKLIAEYLRTALSRSLLSRLGYLLAYGAFRTLRAKMDPRGVNGGVFLGLNGIVVKSHGGTDGTGFASAIDVAVDMASADIPKRIAEELDEIPSDLLEGVVNGHSSQQEPEDEKAVT